MSELPAPGFGHQLCNVFCLIEEARLLNRVPILPTVFLPRLHNNGRVARSRLAKYLNFGGWLPEVEVLTSEEAYFIRFQSIEKVGKATETVELKGSHAQLLIRIFPDWKYYEAEDRFPQPLGVKDGTSRRWMNSFAHQRMRSSSRVEELSNQVMESLIPPVFAVHVRRGDRLKEPGWDEATSPENILRRLQLWIPMQGTLYLASNEQNPDFFSPLERYFDVKTSFDFKILRDLVDVEMDNFMLFSVESEIMRQADFCMSTEYFKGPVLTPYSLMGPVDIPKPNLAINE